MARQKPRPGQIPLFDTYPKSEGTPSDAPDALMPLEIVPMRALNERGEAEDVIGTTIPISGTVNYFPPPDPLPITEDRTSEQLKADGDDKWPNGEPYVPPVVIEMQSRPDPEDARSMPYIPEPGEPGYEPHAPAPWMANAHIDSAAYREVHERAEELNAEYGTTYEPFTPQNIGPHERRMIALQAAAAAGEPAPSIDQLYGTAIANVRAVAIADARTSMEAAAAETEAAIQQVSDGATEFDKLRCRRGIDGVLHDLAFGMRFTTDDVWKWLERNSIAPPREPRLLGAVMLEYKKDGKIVATGNYLPSIRRHKTPITEWEKRFHNE